MRILLALALFAAACGGSKKSAQAPAAAPPGEPGAAEERDGEAEGEGMMKERGTPDDPDDPVDLGADPCDGGE